MKTMMTGLPRLPFLTGRARHLKYHEGHARRTTERWPKDRRGDGAPQGGDQIDSRRNGPERLRGADLRCRGPPFIEKNIYAFETMFYLINYTAHRYDKRR